MSAASFDDLGTGHDDGSPAYRDEDFPGRVSFHLSASEIDRYEGRARCGEEYREETASRAFPGWRTEEIHLALTGERWSEKARRDMHTGLPSPADPEH